MFDAETLENKTQEIKTSREQVENAQAKITEINIAQEDRSKMLNQLGGDMRRVEREMEQAAQDLQHYAIDKQKHETSAYRLENELKQDKHEKALHEMVEKQPDFYSALGKRFEIKIDELDDGLEDFGVRIGTGEFVQKIRHRLDGFEISREVIQMREIRDNYSNHIRALCEQRLKGATVSASAKQTRLRFLDEFIFLPAVEAMWNV